MSRPVMTYALAMAAAKDAANRQMRAAGRPKWNWDDAQLAISEFHRLFAMTREGAASAVDHETRVNG